MNGKPLRHNFKKNLEVELMTYFVWQFILFVHKLEEASKLLKILLNKIDSRIQLRNHSLFDSLGHSKGRLLRWNTWLIFTDFWVGSYKF